MALKVSGYSSSNTAYKIVSDTDSDENAETDVTGASGRIYQIYIKNDASSNTSYVKLKLTSGAVTVGTTEPDLVLAAGPSAPETYVFPAGLPFTQLTFWTTATAATNNSAAPPSTEVIILCT